MSESGPKDVRLARILDHITRLADGDHSVRLDVPSEPDSLDAVAMALNMLAENLSAQSQRRSHSENLQQDAFDLYENAPAKFASIDPVSKNIVKCNETLARRLGYGKEELLGNPARKIFPEDQWEAVYAHIDTLARDSVVANTQFELLAKDGQRLPVNASASAAVGSDGTLARYQAVWVDISHIRKLENQLLQAQKLEAVGRLAGGVAHDFNNILSVISTCAHVISEDSPASREDSDEILSAVERAGALTKQLVALASPQVFEEDQVDLNEVVLSLDRMLRRVLGADVELVTVPAAKLWGVTADPTKMQQLVLNLVVNARDAMPGGGRLTITTANATSSPSMPIDGVPTGEYVRVSVGDTGTGIPEQVRDRIFEPFFTTKRPGRGTGLGLSVCHGVVSRANGYITLDSAEGRGSVFHVFLPRGEGVAPVVEPKPAAPPLAGAGERILVVDDEPRVRRATARVLRQSGYEVMEASAGTDALRLVATTEGIDLLITDVMMPAMTGVELAERLQTSDPNLGVLFISGYSSVPIQPTAEFLSKPVLPESLLSKVRTMLDAS